MIRVEIFIVLVLLFSANSILAQSQTPNSGQGNRKLTISPSMAIIFICLISAFFLMGFISVYVRHCSERRHSFTDDDGTGGFRQSRRARGLDPTVVETFPTFFYSDVKGHKLGQTALECAVCLLEFEDDEVLRLLPKCSHVFHRDCIDAWLAFHVTCPVCRANLLPVPGDVNHVITLFRDNDNEAIEPHAPPPVDLTIDIESPEIINTSRPPNQNVPRRSTPRRSRNTAIILRSHSTGHSVVQPGENCERFTLRLPESVRSQLVNSTGLRRSMSVVAFPRARSSRKGFRSISVGTGLGNSYENYERSDRGGRSGRWNFRMTSPFISRTGSTKSPSGVGGEIDVTATPRSLMTTIKSPLDGLFRGTDKDNVGERSTDRLRPDDIA